MSEQAAVQVEMQRHGPPVDVDRIRSAERELGVDFPKDYLAFLLLHNGGKARDPAFNFERKGVIRWGWLEFCSITDSSNDPGNLQGANRRIQEERQNGFRVPQGAVAIGYDQEDNPLLLLTSGRRAGEVWLKIWDDADEGKAWDGAYKLSGSFSELLKSMKSTEAARSIAESKGKQGAARKQPKPNR